MENQEAGVAEAGRRKGLKNPCDPLNSHDISGNIGCAEPAETGADQPGLETLSRALDEPGWQGLERLGRKLLSGDEQSSEIDRRLHSALHDAGRSALGLPGTVETMKAMLEQAGLALVLA